MSDPYRPGRQSRVYHSLSKSRRAEIVKEVDRIFREQTGVTRSLHPSSDADLHLRRKWLRIRDDVMEQREIDEDMEFRREMFVSGLVDVILEEMESEGWKEAVKLLEIWSTRPATVRPKYTAPVTDVVKLDWVLQYSRAITVYDKLLEDRIWTNTASQKRIAAFLKANPRAAGQTFGNLSLSVDKVDKEWINSRPVVGGLAFDGLAGALGSFHLQVAIAGKLISIDSTEFQMSIDEIGIYAKDSFDFNTNDFLGIWGHRDEPVYDSDFRQWRTENNAGGDFLVFSDIKRKKLNSPDVVKGKF